MRTQETLVSSQSPYSYLPSVIHHVSCFSVTKFSSLFSTILLSYQYHKLKSRISTRLLDNAHKFMISHLNWLSILVIHVGIFLFSFLSLQQLFKIFSTLLKLPNPPLQFLALSLCLCLLLDGENRNHKKGNCPTPCHLSHRFPLQVCPSFPSLPSVIYKVYLSCRLNSSPCPQVLCSPSSPLLWKLTPPSFPP